MKIIPKSPGVWQAGPLGICDEEHLGKEAQAVYIDAGEPLEEWRAVFGHYKQVIYAHGRFLSLAKGFSKESHVLESDRIHSAQISFGLNVPLLIELAAHFAQEGEEIQRDFPVTETKEYTLQADLETYFHEVHSPLFEKRSADLRALREDGINVEKERVRLTHELVKNFEAQAELLEVIALSAPKAAHLSSSLIAFAQAAGLLAHVNRGDDGLSFKAKMETWLPLIRKNGWRPILIGTPESLEPLLQDIYTL